MGGPAKEEEKKEIKHDNPDTHMVLLGKDQREEDYYFAPTAKKKAKSKNKGGGDSGGKAKPIKHNAETFKLFDQLKLNAPITTDDVPALIEKLDEQLASYQEKVKEWEVKKDAQKKAILEGTYVEEKEAEAAEEKGEEEE